MPAMQADESFHDLVRRLRQGDQRAAAEFVRVYEPELRRVIRFRLTDPYLRRLVDSGDVCQSVMANFLLRAALGQFELDDPGRMLRLLATMARNKLLNLARDRRREREARAGGDPEALDRAADSMATPSQIVQWNELMDKARRNLTEQENYLAQQRALGRSWADIAASAGESPEALRKRLARAMDRVSQQLGLQEADDA